MSAALVGTTTEAQRITRSSMAESGNTTTVCLLTFHADGDERDETFEQVDEPGKELHGTCPPQDVD